MHDYSTIRGGYPTPQGCTRIVILCYNTHSTILRSCVCVGIVRLPFTLRSYTICHALAPTQFAHFLAIGHGSPCLFFSLALFRKRSFQYVNVHSVGLHKPIFKTCSNMRDLHVYLCSRARSRRIIAGAFVNVRETQPRTPFALLK